MRRMVWLAVAVIGFGGCKALPEEKAINLRNADLGAAIAANPEAPPAVQVQGAEVAANAKALDGLTFADVPQTVAVPTSPEESAALAREAAEQRAARASLWGMVRDAGSALASQIPGGSIALAAIGGLVPGLVAWFRSATASKRNRTLLTATMAAVDEVRDGADLGTVIAEHVDDPATRAALAEAVAGLIKDRLSAEQSRAGVGALAAEVLAAVRARP